jgi:hypothetical protein
MPAVTRVPAFGAGKLRLRTQQKAQFVTVTGIHSIWIVVNLLGTQKLLVLQVARKEGVLYGITQWC